MRSNRAAGYARERVVFGRAIGQNQGIQHPLAESWAYLESAWWMCLRAASLYDSKQPCGAEANAAKLLGARAAFDACKKAVMTHGGMGYAKEYQVERLFRESMLPMLAPVTEQLILSFHRRERARSAEIVLNLSFPARTRQRAIRGKGIQLVQRRKLGLPFPRPALRASPGMTKDRREKIFVPFMFFMCHARCRFERSEN